MGRYRRLSTWVALEVDAIPSQRPRLLGPGPHQEAQDDVGVQAGRACRLDQGNGLTEGERLGRAAPLAGGRVHEHGDIAAHLVVGLGVPDGPRQPGVRHAHRPGGAGSRQLFQRRPDGSRRELTQRHCPDDGDERLQDFPLGADYATPAARTMPMGLRVAALPPSDRSRCRLRPSRACPSWAAAYRFADRLATGMAPP
jgi:hypothetical protein